MKSYGPFHVSEETLHAFPIVKASMHPASREDLLQALTSGFLFDTRAHQFQTCSPIIRAYYSWCCNTFTPFIVFTKERSRVGFEMDLLPSCQTFSDEACVELKRILLPFRVPRSGYGLGGSRWNSMDAVCPEAAPQIGKLMVEFVLKNGRNDEKDKASIVAIMDAARNRRASRLVC